MFQAVVNCTVNHWIEQEMKQVGENMARSKSKYKFLYSLEIEYATQKIPFVIKKPQNFHTLTFFKFVKLSRLIGIAWKPLKYQSPILITSREVQN